MSAIHGISVGGNLFDVTDSSNVAPIELTGSATRSYAKGRLLILSNGLLYKTTRPINSGETLIANNNIRQTNVDELIAELDTDSNLIAPTENETTSSDDYSIGEQIARSGLLYNVIDDITTGDTFVVGNNIKLAGSVTEQLSQKLNTKVIDLADMAEYNNDLSMLPDGVFFVRSTVFASNTIANRPFADGGAMVISKRLPANNAKIMTVEPFVRSNPTYTGIGYPEINDWTWDSHVISSNPNLLDNPWFTVNQRGQSIYSGAVYGVDRWRSWENGAVTIKSRGIGTTKQIAQVINDILPEINHKTVTISALLANGTIVSTTGYLDIPTGTGTERVLLGTEVTDVCNLLLYGNLEYASFQVNTIGTHIGVELEILACKLELGSVSTLAMDTAPNYATELLKCQRYCIALNPEKINYMFVGMGFAYSVTEIDCIIPVPVKMRRAITIVDASQWKLTDGTNWITPSQIALYRAGGVIKAVITSTGLTIRTPYFMFTDNSDLMLISADL